MTKAIRFTYFTGVRGNDFDAATLCGSWDGEGRYSDQWSETSMTRFAGPDGCPAFTAERSIDARDPLQTFRWGVRLRRGERSVWGILREVVDVTSQERTCSFRIGDPHADVQEYFLNSSRWLGAQRYGKGIRFSVWAPNAQAIDVVVGNLWQQGTDPQRESLIDPSKIPALTSSARDTICGGYIQDGSGAGSVRRWGPFAMENRGGIWSTDPGDPQLAEFVRFDHLPYMFRVKKDDGSVVYKTDLYSRCQIGYGTENPAGAYMGLTIGLDGKVSCSVVVDPDKVCERFTEPVWPETNWVSPEVFFAQTAAAAEIGKLRLQDLVIYELHLGTLGIERGPGQPGTLQDACAFLDYLRDLGVNAVELLPLAEFGGKGEGWGYATTHYHAIEYSGGGRDQYKWFVRECHSRGIAVILDVVFNHYNPEASRAEWMYDTNSHEKNSYYWYEGKPSDYPAFNSAVSAAQQGQGGYIDNISSGWAPRFWEEQVRNLFVSSAIALVEEFHIDGLRVDQTTSIRNYNSLHANGTPVESANIAGTKFLRELTRSLRLLCPNVMLIAEDHANWDGVARPPEDGGLGFDAVWHADFYHHLIGDTDKPSSYAKLVKTAGMGGDGPLAMDVFAAQLQVTAGGGKVVYNESHDEAGNGQGTDRTINVASNSAPLVGDTRYFAEGRCRFAAGVTLLSAGVPMFLFGEEVGSQRKFLYDRVLENREDYEALRRTMGSGMFHFYSDLINLRKRNSAMRSTQLEIIYVHNGNRLLAFRRWDEHQEFIVCASLNNSPFNSPSYFFQSQLLRAGRWKEVFNSDSATYGGRDIGNAGAVLESSSGFFACILPANGFVVFQGSN